MKHYNELDKSDLTPSHQLRITGKDFYIWPSGELRKRVVF